VSFQDHFSVQAAIYAKARPKYPPALFAELAQLAPGRGVQKKWPAAGNLFHEFLSPRVAGAAQ